MLGDRHYNRGSVTVEFALLLPFLVLLVIGGWVLVYMAFAKTALAMTANRAARDLAAATQEHAALRQSNQAYHYDGGFGESFGLPRWALHGLVMKSPVAKGKGTSDQAVQVAVCYRIPINLPFGVVGGAAEQADLVEPPAAWEGLWEQAGGVGERGLDLWEKGRWLEAVFQELLEGSTPDFSPYQGAGSDDPDRLEEAVRSLCEPPDRFRERAVILTARSAYLLQTEFKPSGRRPK